MGTDKFRMEGNMISELRSEMQLQVIHDEAVTAHTAWISGWFRIKENVLVIKKFIVLDVGNPTYRLASKAVDFWGNQVLGVEQADAIEMSPLFGTRLIIPLLG